MKNQLQQMEQTINKKIETLKDDLKKLKKQQKLIKKLIEQEVETCSE